MKHFSHIFILAAAIFALATPAPAQNLSEKQVQKGLQELRNFKHRMLERELDLTKDQQAKFFDAYDRMDDELMAIADETRETERRIAESDKTTDAEYTAAAREIFEAKRREAETELKYFDRFAEILTPRQLCRLKPAERKIALALAKYHGRQAKR